MVVDTFGKGHRLVQRIVGVARQCALRKDHKLSFSFSRSANRRDYFLAIHLWIAERAIDLRTCDVCFGHLKLLHETAHGDEPLRSRHGDTRTRRKYPSLGVPVSRLPASISIR